MTAPIAEIVGIMDSFAERTGLTSPRPPRRYLWTDAFAVCNYLALYLVTGEARWAEHAAALIHQVHDVLGRHRPDDTRTGWISGLPDADGERHPVAGGLRIGKPLPERAPGEPLDEQLEWERDGQYYHYLTRWLHALLRSARVIGDGELLRHGAELAAVAYRGFGHPAVGGMRLYWKMSIDLSRPAVKAMGEHDPLDGLVATAAIDAAVRGVGSPGGVGGSGAARGPGTQDWSGATRGPRDQDWSGGNGGVTPGDWSGANGGGPAGDGSGANREARARGWSAAPPTLHDELAGLAAMCAGRGWATSDALGIGGLLTSALQLARLGPANIPERDQLLARVLHDAARSLDLLAVGRFPAGDAGGRLAFRELGLAIGLAAVEHLLALREREELPRNAAAPLERLVRHLPIRDSLHAFWREPRHQLADSWIEHQDINDVMLATSLLPGGYLG